jgi:hypothetical protein
MPFLPLEPRNQIGALLPLRGDVPEMVIKA